MNFTSKEYLPNSEERIRRLQKVIRGRPVAIFAAGPSLKELEGRIGQLGNMDICYAGLNNFSIAEQRILKQIKRQFSLIICGCSRDLPDKMESITIFLDRKEDNMFISTFCNDAFSLVGNNFNLNSFLVKYDKKLIFLSVSKSIAERQFPNGNFPLHFIVTNTLMCMVQMAIIGGAPKIVLFGADGYCKDNVEKYYYCHDSYGISRHQALIDDTNKLVNPVVPVGIKNLYRTYNLRPIDIVNCSEESFYTVFPKVSYDDCFDWLLGGRRFDNKSDLRVPKASVISFFANDDAAAVTDLSGTIYKQSYSDYEQIVISDKSDAVKQGRMEKLPFIERVFLKKEQGYLNSFRKAMLFAKGEYIFCFHSGDKYLSEDWFNDCIEILENDSDISLVWGLPEKGERVLHGCFPSQGKRFIYYWLKKKIFFSPESFCVRKKVLEECFSAVDPAVEDVKEYWLNFSYIFNIRGYQPYFISHQINQPLFYNSVKIEEKERLKRYNDSIESYRHRLIRGKEIHRYRDGEGKLSEYGFSLMLFIFFRAARFIKNRLPQNKSYLLLQEALECWLSGRMRSVLQLVSVKIRRRLSSLRFNIRLNV